MAPEVLKSRYDSKSDIWSFEVIFNVMLTGNLPFYVKSNKETFSKIIAGDYDLTDSYLQNLCSPAKKKFQKPLMDKPNNRFSASQALFDQNPV